MHSVKIVTNFLLCYKLLVLQFQDLFVFLWTHYDLLSAWSRLMKSHEMIEGSLVVNWNTRNLSFPVDYKRTFNHFMTTGATEKSLH